MIRTSSNQLEQFIDACIRRLRDRFLRVHRDERGTINILAVFALLMFTMLLAMIMNVAFHADDKVQMQNAADASAYTGGAVIARGMNSIAFANHLMSDVFAMTAFMREAKDRNIGENPDEGTDSLPDRILDAWEVAAEQFSESEFEKFRLLGEALQESDGDGTIIDKEREVVRTFVEMAYAMQEFSLSVFEEILAQELIPKFQRDVRELLPQAAQVSAAEIAMRNGLGRQTRRGREPQTAVVWSTNVVPVADASSVGDARRRVIPAIDPSPSQADYGQFPSDVAAGYLATSRRQRRNLALHYLQEWDMDPENLNIEIFRRHARMSMFFQLWQLASHSQMRALLEVEYPDSNLPMILRSRGTRTDNDYVEDDFSFVTVVYRDHLSETAPGIFRNPLKNSNPFNESNDKLALTFAQVRLFVPYRLMHRVSHRNCPNLNWGGNGWPQGRDLLNQNWSIQLVPATVRTLPVILQTPPPAGIVAAPFAGQFQGRLPNLGGASIDDIRRVNKH